MKKLKQKNKKSVLIVQGGNYGSEAKGLVAETFCRFYNVDYAVRTGSINAGHTVYYKGKEYKMQQIPVGWVNPKTKLVIGAGAYVHPPTLAKEIELINQATGKDVKERLYIDFKAGVHLDEHHNAEQGAKLHERMGSTGEGVAAALVDKMARRFEYVPFSKTQECKELGVWTHDTVTMLNKAADRGKKILLEGTQGTMLDLHLGHYPFVTSRQVTACAWATEAGLSPSLNYEVALVVRAYPIRVAGNSGPLPKEINWEDFAERVNSERNRFGLPPMVGAHALSKYKRVLADTARSLGLPDSNFAKWTTAQRTQFAEQLTVVHKKTFEAMTEYEVKDLKNLFEMTTVTKKLRRIAEMDERELKYAVNINRPEYIVLTFLNYKFPTLWDVTTWKEVLKSPVGEEVKKYIARIEKITGTPVKWVNTGKNNLIRIR